MSQSESVGDPEHGRGRFLPSVRWNLAASFGQQAARLGVTILLAHLLVPDDFGLMAMALVVLGLFTMFLDLGTGQAIVQKSEVEARLLDTLFVLHVGTGAIAAGALAGGAGLVAAAFDDARLAPILRTMSPLLLLTASTIVIRAVLMRGMRFDRLAKSVLAGTAANAVVALAAALAGAGVWALVAGEIAAGTVSAAALWWIAPRRPRPRFHPDDLRAVASFSVSLTLYNVYHYAATRADRLLIGRFLGATALGFYAMSLRLTRRTVRPVAAAIDPVLLSRLSRLGDDDERAREEYLRVAEGAALLLVPALVGLAVVCGPFVRTAIGEAWAPLIPLMSILALVAALNAVVGRVSTIYRAKGRTDLLLRWGVVRGAVLFASYVVGLPWGVQGVVASFAIASALVALPSMAIPLRLIRLPVGRLLRRLVPCLASTLVMAIVATGTRVVLERADAAHPVVLVATVAAGAATYATAVLLLRPHAWADVRRALAMGPTT